MGASACDAEVLNVISCVAQGSVCCAGVAGVVCAIEAAALPPAGVVGGRTITTPLPPGIPPPGPMPITPAPSPAVFVAAACSTCAVAVSRPLPALLTDTRAVRCEAVTPH